MNPLVSIIVPIYRTSLNYVEICFDSIVAQSYPHNKLELVVFIEDSPDKYLRHLERLLKNIKNINILYAVGEQSRGLAYSRNEAIRMSNGKIILLLDSDDFLDPHAVSRCIKKINAGFDFVYTNHKKISADGASIIHYRDKRFYQGCIELYKHTVFNPLLHATFVFHCQVFRRSVFEEVGGFREDLKYGEEVDFHLRVDELCEYNNYALIPEYLYYYRDNPDSISHQKDNYTLLINNISKILVEGAQRRKFDVQKAERIGRVKPTNAAHYALYNSANELLKFPYLDYDTLKINSLYMDKTGPK